MILYYMGPSVYYKATGVAKPPRILYRQTPKIHFVSQSEVIALAEEEDRNLQDEECSTPEIAGLLNLTERRIQQLTREGIISQVSRGRYKLGPTLTNYVTWIQRRSLGANDDEKSFRKEKALLTQINRERAEIELNVIRGSVHTSDDVEAVMNTMLQVFRTRMLGIPAKTAPLLLNQEDLSVAHDILREEIYLALQELSNYDPEKFHRRNADRVGKSLAGAKGGPKKGGQTRGKKQSQ